MNISKINLIVILNFLVPIALGTIIYYLFSPDVMFVQRIDEVFGGGLHFYSIVEGSTAFRIVRNFFPDMLWAYALIFALFFVSGNKTAEISKIFLIAFSFSAVMELLQMTPLAKGTFDMLDILTEFIAEIFSVFIIKINFMRRTFK